MNLVDLAPDCRVWRARALAAVIGGFQFTFNGLYVIEEAFRHLLYDGDDFGFYDQTK